MVGTSYEQFRSVLGNEVARRNIGLSMSDETARLMLADEALTRALYEQWVAGEGLPPDAKADQPNPKATSDVAASHPRVPTPSTHGAGTRVPDLNTILAIAALVAGGLSVAFWRTWFVPLLAIGCGGAYLWRTRHGGASAAKWLAWVGLGLGAVCLIVAGDSLGEDARQEASPAISGPTARPTPTPTRTPTPARTPTPTPTPADPNASTFIYRLSCNVNDAYLTFTDYRDVWATGVPVSYCDPQGPRTARLTDLETQALTVAYGEVDAASLKTLYAICAQTAGYGYDELVSQAQAAEVAGALLLCPDHPRAADAQALIAAQQATIAQAAADEQLRAEGKLIGTGSYLIGVDIVAGTWQSQGERVEECYWEISDAQGNIIDNAFISVAPQFTITVPASAAGLTISGCGFRWIGP